MHGDVLSILVQISKLHKLLKVISPLATFWSFAEKASCNKCSYVTNHYLKCHELDVIVCMIIAWQKSVRIHAHLHISGYINLYTNWHNVPQLPACWCKHQSRREEVSSVLSFGILSGRATILKWLLFKCQGCHYCNDYEENYLRILAPQLRHGIILAGEDDHLLNNRAEQQKPNYHLYLFDVSLTRVLIIQCYHLLLQTFTTGSWRFWQSGLKLYWEFRNTNLHSIYQSLHVSFKWRTAWRNITPISFKKYG